MYDIKELTAEIHQNAERQEFVKTLMSGSIEPNLYATYLYNQLQCYSVLEKYGMDSSDIVPMMMDALTFDGGMWGLPLDIHAGLFHTNLDLMAKAGLVKDGKPFILLVLQKC